MPSRLLVVLLAGALAALVVAPVSDANPGHGHDNGRKHGNSWAAHMCNHGGYKALARSNHTSFRNTGACVSYAAHGGTFGTSGAAPAVSGVFTIPAGEVATISNARWNLGPCDALAYGYQLSTGTTVTLANKAGGTCANANLADVTIGPFTQSVTMRIFLNDTGDPAAGASCDYTFFSDGPHALVTGSDPWQIDIRDSAFCTKSPTTAFPPTAPGEGNLDLTLTIS